MEYTRRSSRSGSLVITPDHHVKPSVSALLAVDDAGESSNYLEAINSSSTTNNTCSFDAPPDILPPIPPRITNPPRNMHITTSENLIIIDTDDQNDVAPIPVARTKTSMTKTQPQTFGNNRFGFENNFIPNANSLRKNHITSRPISLIEPPSSRSQNNKLNMTNESKTFEVC